MKQFELNFLLAVTIEADNAEGAEAMVRKALEYFASYEAGDSFKGFDLTDLCAVKADNDHAHQVVCLDDDEVSNTIGKIRTSLEPKED